MHGGREKYNVAVGHQGANQVFADDSSTMRHAVNGKSVW